MEENHWPFPESFTFAFELEFIFEGQFNDMAKVRHDRNLLDKIRRRLHLSPAWDLEKVANRHIHPTRGPVHIYEIRTSLNQKYFKNTPEQWDSVKNELSRIQENLPAGIWSAHMHASCSQAITANNKLSIDYRYFGVLIRIFEGMWYILSGFGYDIFSNRKNELAAFGLGFIENLKLCPNHSYSMLGEREIEGVFCHHAMINLSRKYPTIEIKRLSGLFKEHEGKNILDTKDLQRDIWWIFALLKKLLNGSKKTPLALLGTPISLGEKPSLKQITHFLNLLYEDDEIGKSIAFKRFLSLQEHPITTPPHLRSARRLEGAYPFYTLGLRVVYELHEECEGLNEQVEETILNTPHLFQQLRTDLKAAPVKLPLTEYFSHPELLKAL